MIKKTSFTLTIMVFSLHLIAQKINEIKYNQAVLPIEELSSNVNSNYAERLPIISPDGRTLYFARKYHPGNVPDQREKSDYEKYKDDIWVSRRRSDGTWSRAKNIGAPLNDDSHNFVISVSADGKTLYLANKYRTSKDGVSYSKKMGSGWSKPKALKIPNMYNRSRFVGYHVNVKEDVLIMAVERSKTEGGRDLYVSFRKNGDDWTEPKNLGKTINTASEEASVFIAADNKTIYFSSMGHPGYGGFDVFMSRRLDDSWTKWTEPLNLGKSINTKGNDYNYTIPASGEYAYFSSDAGETNLMSKLYKIQLPAEVRPRPVTVINFRMKKLPEKPAEPEKKEETVHLNITMKKKKPVREIESTTAVRPHETKGLNKKKSKKLAPRKEVEEQVQVVIIDEDTPDELPEIPGYFPVREQKETEIVYEEIDYDGDDPEIIEEIKRPKKIRRMAKRDAKKDSPELETLKQKLLSVEYELETIEEERESDQITGKKPEKVVIKYKRRIEEDPRFDRLKSKYSKLIPKSVDEIEDDPDLARMKRKFKNLYYEDESDKKSDVAQKPKKEKYKPDHKKSDEIAAAMAKGEPVPKTPDLEEEKPTYRPDHERSDEIVAAATGDESAIRATPSFEELQAEVREEVEEELIDEVKLELQQEMLADVRSELENELSGEIREQLQDDLKDDIERELRADLEQSVTEKLQRDLEGNVKDDLRSELREEIEKELREVMRDDIEKSLREQLADEIKDELREEMSYRYKQEVEAQLRREVERKVRKQNKERERDIALNAPTETPEAPAYRELEENITLYPIEVGQIIPLNNIYFDANEATLKNESDSELNRALKFLSNNPNVVVEISGHTNGLCSHEFANELSTYRSATVASYLANKGISKSRVSSRGYGKTQPIASNDNIEGRRKNQRVEMKILEIK